MKLWLIAVVVALSCSLSSFAWGKKGHEVVAYIAYQHLDTATKKEVDFLITLNPCFTEWQTQVSTLPIGQQSAAIFMLAATWPDAIKNGPGLHYDCQPNHRFIFDGVSGPGDARSEDVPPDTPEASQNVGYGDNRRHKYWHFVDNPFSPDGTPLEPASTPNATTEILLLSKALKTSEDNDLKSYDLVWIEHLVGDVHEPLHDVSRFTSGHPAGDQGGNLVLLCQTEGCTRELHSYWDDLPGPGNDLPGAIAMGQSLFEKFNFDDDVLDVEDPASWASEGFVLAKTVAYASPISVDAVKSTPAVPDAAYKAKAKATVDSQLALAGQRLGKLLTDYLN